MALYDLSAERRQPNNACSFSCYFQVAAAKAELSKWSEGGRKPLELRCCKHNAAP